MYKVFRGIKVFISRLKLVSEHDIPLDLVLNLDQTPLTYVSLFKNTIDVKVLTTVSIKGVDDKRQVTATFTAFASDSFLPIQLIYYGKTKHCLPKYDLPNCFDIKFSPNHWSNFETCVSLLEKSFPILKRRKKTWLPKTFKGEDNAEIKELRSKNECELVIVLHNLANKFQPLDITIN